jgi:hypothetical protein
MPAFTHIRAVHPSTVYADRIKLWNLQAVAATANKCLLRLFPDPPLVADRKYKGHYTGKCDTRFAK